MSRDDSALYTGMSSAVARTIQEGKKELKKETAQTRGKLTPAAEFITSFIDQEISKTKDISELIMDPTSADEDIKSLLLAKKMYLNMLTNLKTNINNKLREHGDG